VPGTIHLHPFPAALAPGTTKPMLATPSPGLKQTLGAQPSAQCIGADHVLVLHRQILRRQRRPEARVFGAVQFEDRRPRRFIGLAIGCPPSKPMSQTRVTTIDVPTLEPPGLTLADPKHRSRLGHRHLPVANLTQNLQPPTFL